MSLSRILILAGVLANLAFGASADPQQEDDLLRLPGQGELRQAADRERVQAKRLKPGAGLFLTFDVDEDGRISPAELDSGIPVAFNNADANQDGYMTALEQQAWAESLPTRDDSLANPVRFDPNLDRRVNLDEFTKVVTDLGVDYADRESGEIILANLKASDEKSQRQLDAEEMLKAREEVLRRRQQQTRSRQAEES